MNHERLVFRIHAIKRMFQRHISIEDVKEVLRAGKAIEEYPDDFPFPSRLILGWCGPRPIHVVAAENAAKGETIIVTVYEPDQEHWESPSERRKT